MKGGFFEVHNSGKAQRIAKPRIVGEFNIQILNAYVSNEEIREADKMRLYERNILVMPVPMSPVYALLHHDKESCWIPRYINSFKLLFTFRCILQCYANNPHMPIFKNHPQRVIDTRNAYETGLFEREEHLYTELRPVYRAFKDNTVNERDTLQKFLEILENFTIFVINHTEKAIMALFDIKAPLMEVQAPDASVFAQKDTSDMMQTMHQFFDAKQKIMNVKLQKSTPDGVTFIFSDWFDMDDMPHRLANAPSDQIFKGYMDRLTAFEYFKFMDCDGIL